jgi:ABC-type glycerol-3-phosphate transport system substrate-binding protein
MKHWKVAIQIALIASMLVGCSGIPSSSDSISPELTPTPSPPLVNNEAEQTNETLPITLLIWLPPQFDPAGETEAGTLLQEKLDAFGERHPGVRVDVRIKAAEGQASLYESLNAASAAAPLALPDLIALSTNELRAAATKNLVHPLDEYLNAPLEEDWYDFAGELGSHEDKTFGLPFAIDALVMAYRPEIVDTPPSTWEFALETSGLLSFPAADPQAQFGITLYLSQVNTLEDESQNIFLDENALNNVFSFFENGQSNNLMPFWLTQFESDDASWQAFTEGRTNMAITWATRYLNNPEAGFLAAPIPTESGAPFSLTTGWSWALTGNDPDRYALAVELAEFLTEEEFLGDWTASAGYFPPRADALSRWPEGLPQALASQILPSAVVIPEEYTIGIIGDLLSQHIIQVIKNESNADQATQSILEALENR